jgi:hypothetical protein
MGISGRPGTECGGADEGCADDASGANRVKRLCAYVDRWSGYSCEDQTITD